MVNVFYIVVLLLLVFDLPASLSEPDGYRIRSKRSIGSFFKRLFGRRKTGFQGTVQAQGNYNTQGSSYYPSYAYPNLNQYQAAATYDSNSGQYPSYGSLPYSPYGSYPQASGSYPSYAVAPNYGSQGSGVDFHSILDQFVRQNGLSPTGDQETAASNIQAKGDTPVFSFKKLYSFPFYFNTDQQGSSGYNLQIPFMKRHIRRMAQDYVQRRQWRANQKMIKQMAKRNPQLMVNHYVASQLGSSPVTQYGNLRRGLTVNEPAASGVKTAYYVGQPLEKKTDDLNKKSSVESGNSSKVEIGEAHASVPVRESKGKVAHQSVSLKTSYSAA